MADRRIEVYRTGISFSPGLLLMMMMVVVVVHGFATGEMMVGSTITTERALGSCSQEQAF